MSDTTITVNFPDNSTLDLPVLKASMGTNVVDIRTLPQKALYSHLIQGFASTASCESKITFIDGEKGILLYRGYPIEALA